MGFRGPKVDRCMKNECSFKMSELVTDNMQPAWAGIEASEEQIDEAETIEDIKTALEDATNGIEESRDMYSEANDNWRGGQGGNEEWEEKIAQLEDCLSEVEGWEPDQFPDDVERDDYETEEEYNEAKDETLSEARDSAKEMLGNLQLP